MILFPPEVKALIRRDRTWLLPLVVTAGLIAVLEGAELVSLLLLGNLLLGEDIASIRGGRLFEQLLEGFSPAGALIAVGAVFGVVVLLRLGFALGYRRAAYQWASRTAVSLHHRIMDSLVQAPVSVFDRRRLGEIINDLMDAPFGAIWAIDGTTALLTSLFSILMVCAALAYISPWLLLAAAGVTVPLMLAIARPAHRGLRGLQQQLNDRRVQASGVAANVINGIRDLKAISGERRMAALFAEEMNGWGVFFTRVWFMRYVPGPTLQAVIQLAFATSVVVLAMTMSVEEISGQLATLAIFGYSLFRFYPVLSNISTCWMDLNRAVPGLRSANAWLAIPSDPLVAGTEEAPEHPVDIHFSGVSFAYENGFTALSDIDLHIPAGHVVSFVGESGAGKSTLIDLLLKFRAPTTGDILIGQTKRPLRQVTRGSWLRQIGVVRQDVILFPASVRQNLLLWKPDAADADIEAACRQAGAWDFIERLPQGMETLLGDRGSTLSGGQRQRIAIARTLLRDPKVLILDEALSALDGETEAEVLTALTSAPVRRTILLVSHRLTTIQQSDEIVVIDRGRVVERGSHTELIGRTGGRYTQLFATQLTESVAG